MSKNLDERQSPKGSGSDYHKKHGNHIPDYGGNTKDPNAKKA